MNISKKKGMIPVFECNEAIPCNPCQYSCPFGAIQIKGGITNLPELDAAKCKGCKICAAICPGQAIYLMDENYTQTEGRIAFPYEFTPLPLPGTAAVGVNSMGENVCSVIISEVEQKELFNNTPVVTVIVPKEYLKVVRFIKLEGGML